MNFLKPAIYAWFADQTLGDVTRGYAVLVKTAPMALFLSAVLLRKLSIEPFVDH